MKRTSMTMIALASTAFALAACGDADMSEIYDEEEIGQSERAGIGMAEQALVSTGVTIDPRRSLAVTDSAILNGFSLQAVLNQLATQSGVTGLTAAKLFQQLWDTQNPTASSVTTGPHCDTISPVNGFPYGCRPAEGAQALNPSAEMGNYIAIGLFNRFDLAPSTGADCGEYRIVFARNPAAGGGRNFVIFEAVLANPYPELGGLEGCRAVTNFWAKLSSNNDVNSRKNALVDFYFKGLSGFMPVVHFENLGTLGNGRSTTGQIRTNQFMQFNWMLREFKLQKNCGTTCSMLFQPVTDKTNPFGRLFAANSGQGLAPEFQNTFFPSQVASLAVNDINGFGYAVPDKFNTAESDAQASIDLYTVQFNGNTTFRANIQSQLTNLGSTLTPENIVERAQALSCAGCHQSSNNHNLGGGLIWPSSLQFTHVSEQSPEAGPDGSRFRISPALINVFLPRRKAVLESFVNSPPIHSGVAVNRCLHVVGNNPVPGSNVQSRNCAGIAAQRWNFAAASNEVRSAVGTNLCLEFVGTPVNGANTRVNTCNGSNVQKWTRTAVGELRAVQGSGNMCLDVVNADSVSGAEIQLATCNGTKGQRWFEQPALPVENPVGVPINIRGARLGGQTGANSNIFVGATPGQTISFTVDYTVSQLSGCPNCIDQIMIGIDSTGQGCVYNGIPSATGQLGTGTINITAPSAPGVYYVRFRNTANFSCDLSWWTLNETPSDKDNIAVITVN